MMLTYMDIDTPLGSAILIAEEGHVVKFGFIGQPLLSNHEADCQYAPKSPFLSDAKRQIDEYFSNKRQVFTIPVNPKGTAFQRHVWDTLKEIPFGKTVSYRELTLLTGKNKNFTRAVASAIARNPVMILIPCHRVIGADGSLTGYAGGLERKKTLLEWEGVET
jgi:methylated-DNA-[protein]-cysteine S-methyltransferase